MSNIFSVGDIVDVVGQNIKGKVIEVYNGCRNIVIDDLDSEWEYPESRLEYRNDELSLIKGAKLN
ncbi:hypothetical protein UFOVP26_50 [uncultured Caudovirales phage]|uniref:Uncharacterized protein n=1 Tax=uncultured Caudovirales phage TaxID=2100421 RepID=A0A6J5KN51_9CAUD|nr:hypothetical protein UFOVP26_50 [uncultured Caudovirales phage]CAB4123748.1 hypothetical protein UFOVP44_47 [uncultured Caudovirales phage]CAB5219151.1 hypothetical protein UFOVP220_38 [uncultured Caudovirales phage]